MAKQPDTVVYMRAARARDYVYQKTGVFYTVLTMSRWMATGIVGSSGFRVVLKSVRRVGRLRYTTAAWIDEFIDKVRVKENVDYRQGSGNAAGNVQDQCDQGDSV